MLMVTKMPTQTRRSWQQLAANFDGLSRVQFPESEDANVLHMVAATLFQNVAGWDEGVKQVLIRLINRLIVILQ